MALFTKKKPRPTRKKLLYYPGCLASAKQKGVVQATKSLLTDLGVEYVMLPTIECCGNPAWIAGYEEDFAAIRERNKALLKAAKVERIVSNCPHCTHTFQERYGVEAVHVLQLLEEESAKITKGATRKVNYHHPCTLDKLGVNAKTAVKLLRRANVHVTSENESNGCCGSVGGDYARNNPEAAKGVAVRRAKMFTEKELVTSCPYCIENFKRVKKKAKDVTQVLNEALTE